MATKRKPLQNVIERLNLRVTQAVKGVVEDRVIEETTLLVNDLNYVYDDFFNMLATKIIGQVHNYVSESPPMIAPYMGKEPVWQELSGEWIDTKENYNRALNRPFDYYQGITQALGTPMSPNRLKNKRGFQLLDDSSKVMGASRKRVQRQGASKQSFEQYIKSLARDQSATERFFGPIEMEYAFAERSRNFQVVQKGNVIDRIEAYSKNTVKEMMFEPDFTIRAQVTAFTRLTGVRFSEWSVVDFILKQVDPQNEKQWVKINGSAAFGSRRPMRAMITPLITWYGYVGFKQVMDEFKANLK